ncbi:MAG: hypothetical protein AAF311_09660 [Pseudomonadota bacterium]
MKPVLALLLCGLALPAHASSDTARALLDEGRYEAARTQALSEDTMDGLLVAGEAMAAEIMLMRVDDPNDHARDAVALAEDALSRDPGNAEALFQRALHTGFRTRSSSAFAVLAKGLIGRTEAAIDAFAAAAPDDPRADALRGAWHLGIVRAAGDGRFGASLEDGMAAYDRAVAARPDDIVVLGNYAFSLIVLDDPALRPRARDLLQRIERAEPRGATQAETRERMLRLLAVFDDPDALRERARGLLNTEETAG